MLNQLRRFLLDNSSLSDYIDILRETKDQKLIRLLRDPSNPYSFRSEPGFKYGINDSAKRNLLIKIINSDRPVFNPISHLMLYWYLTVFVAIMYNYFEFGIVLAYEGAWQAQLTTHAALGFSIFTIIVLIIDIMIQFNTGYLKNGMIILQRKRVTKHYIRGLFLFDFVYVILLISCLATRSYHLNYSKLTCLVKFLRLFEIDDYFLRRFNVKRVKKTLYTIFKLSVIVAVIAHAFGVILYVIDLYIYKNGIYAPQFCWIVSSTAYSPINTLPWYLQYFYSFYWGINQVTNISYGDIQGANPIEVIYMLGVMCSSFIIFGYIVNQIIKIILWARASTDLRRKQTLVMEMYMDNLYIPLQLKNQVINHLEFMHRQQKNRNMQLQNQMRDKLPENLKYKLVSNAYSQLNFKINNIFQSSYATKFLFNLIQKKYTFEEQVSSQGETALFLNYLHKGKMEYVVSYGVQQQAIIYESSNQNEFLGHYELFAKRRWPFSIISKKGSTVYSISKEKMLQQIKSIEVLRERFKQVEYEVIFKENFRRIYHTCFFCKVNHDWVKCPERFPIVRAQFHTNIYKRQDGVMIIRRKYHTLNDRHQLKALDHIRNVSNKRLVNIIEKRIAKIREKISQREEMLEIDIAFDWKYYDVTQNLSIKKQAWNSLVEKKLTTIQQMKQMREKYYSLKPIKQEFPDIF